ncbi:DUF6597 domain-containing transcriptional factor [Paenibacillus sp. TAB 01]|uniref:DUF6597 domain-containing transcriptional factor n=1 Tax=Paenibacillus sp. TAB 01 TaxID=3368988 RepID=UPI0037527175
MPPMFFQADPPFLFALKSIGVVRILSFFDSISQRLSGCKFWVIVILSYVRGSPMDAKLHALFRPMQANGRDPAYTYSEWPPSPALKPYVACYWVSEPAGLQAALLQKGGSAVDRVLPDGCTEPFIRAGFGSRLVSASLLRYFRSIVYDIV